jgi:hypothetical protein
MRKSCWLAAFCLLLGALGVGVPASAATVQGGSDLWSTPGDGTTYQDFASSPLPAGFFCAKSVAFTGKVVFRGAPIASDEPGALRDTDTIIERLDDATFNRKGVAVTRLQARALSLESVAPIKTACGSYNVRANLAGEQPITRMKIFRESEDGGRYYAPLALNVKLTFTPVGGGRALAIERPVRFITSMNSWTFQAEDKRLQRARYIRIDSDGDGRPDTYVPGTTSFTPGDKRATGDKIHSSCHDAGTGQHLHCPGGVYRPIDSGLEPTLIAPIAY